jgi:membrane protease YdiL (CAAX protease family)
MTFTDHVHTTPAPAPPGLPTRGVALVEVLLCSGYPTQLSIAGLLRLAGIASTDEAGQLAPAFVFTLSVADSVLLIGLIVFFLRRHGERVRDVMLGSRPVWREALLGVALAPLLLAAILSLLLVLRALVPALHNVPDNPLSALIGSPWAFAMFFIVVLVAGGLREELQRAFLLRRFEQRLGGVWVGLAVTSLAFGVGHTLQGWDAAIATALLGFVWGLLYISRRSAVAPIVSHALFNSAELLRTFIAR